MRSMGKAGEASGLMAMDMSFIGSSSAAVRLDGEGAAPAASVDDGPLAALAYPHCDRLHHPAAVCGTVPRFYVYMEAGEAVGTMVAVAAPCALRRHGAAAGAAGESVMTGMGLVIAWLEGPFFVFAVHDSVLLIRSFILREGCVVHRPPGQWTDTESRYFINSVSPCIDTHRGGIAVALS